MSGRLWHTQQPMTVVMDKAGRGWCGTCKPSAIAIQGQHGTASGQTAGRADIVPVNGLRARAGLTEGEDPP